MTKTMIVAIALFGIAAAGCSSEDDPCATDQCGPVLVDDGSGQAQAPGGTDAATCEAVCAHLDFECGVTDERDCIAACAQGAFTTDELACLDSACGEALLRCLHDESGRTDRWHAPVDS